MSPNDKSKTERKFIDRLPFIGKKPPTVAVIRLAGVIGESAGVGRRGLSLGMLAPAIEKAFSIKRLAAVALEINSPGGSPVQSDLIAGRIRTLANEKEVPVIAFCEDAAASGGYWLACAADEIFAMPGSIVGSIGVISAGFGFVDAIGKLGVERRVHTAGKSKSVLDPFQPEKPADIKILKRIQEDLHRQFIDWVKGRRGDRLDEETELFNGAFWTGRESLGLGLIDGIGERRQVMRDRFGEDVRFRAVVAQKTRLQKLVSGATPGPGIRLDGAVLAEGFVRGLEERAYWSRLGLG